MFEKAVRTCWEAESFDFVAFFDQKRMGTLALLASLSEACGLRQRETLVHESRSAGKLFDIAPTLASTRSPGGPIPSRNQTKFLSVR
ncbi:hypothetical protein MKZ38_008813 [Zalerion maritima]|uniref:Uncharacterized protein n=1 Tax=Zalerion maritima TaxID=339359 RepID=A0AAD5RGE6_9PEZI|nr:hypothetical protein MKZ38_008813 [Zalerion maritima]